MRPGDRDLLAELKALLKAVTPPQLEETRDDGFEPRAAPTAWQGYAAELRDLCRRVLEEADEPTARAFWLHLIETAARHGRRLGGSSS